jgi:uncharacterized membrane protein (DUF2068 family)
VRSAPAAIDQTSSAAGLRTIAVLEALKGLLILLLGLGALTLLHKDVERAAEGLLMHLHLNPDRRIAHAILHAASRMTDGSLWGIAAAAVAYTAVRFTEAWGLWHRRVWAEWFALLSGMLYLPWEIVKIIEKPNRIHAMMLLGNLIILAYMAHIRFRATRKISSGMVRPPAAEPVIG